MWLLASTGLVDRARTLLENLTTTEGRLAVSAVLIVATLLVAGLLAPRLIRHSRDILFDRLLTGRVAGTVEATGEYVPTTLSGLFLRVVQLLVLLLAGISLLVVWGLVGIAVDVLTLIGLSIPLLAQFLATLGLLLFAYVGSNLLQDAIERFSEGNERVTEHQEEIINRVAQLGVLSVAIAGVLTIWGVNLSGLLVGAGFLGIVVGLAARQTLGSLIAGFVLMFSRPFTIGDWVEIGGEEGIVTDITIFNTRLENFDGEFIVMPNDTVNNSAITNRSQKGHLRTRLDVGIDYEADPDRAEDVILAAIDDVDVVSAAPPPQVIPKTFGDSAIVLEVRFWIERPTPPRRWQATAAVVRAVKTALDDAGIKIPFPQRELTGRAESGGFRVHHDTAEVSGEGVRRSETAEPDQ